MMACSSTPVIRSHQCKQRLTEHCSGIRLRLGLYAQRFNLIGLGTLRCTPKRSIGNAEDGSTLALDTLKVD
jgi:hypothetical protein